MTRRSGDDLLPAYDVVVVGGAVVGSSAAYFLSEHPGFDGSVLVVERDPTYARSATALSAASIRHQFSLAVNVRLSRFATEFIADFHNLVAVDGESPELGFRDTGYLFLAADQAQLGALGSAQRMQRSEGAEVSLLDRTELARRFPYLTVDDLSGASLGERNEGTLDSFSLLQGFRRRARHNGVTYVHDEVVGLDLDRPLDHSHARHVQAVRLASGRTVGCGAVINAAGTRGAAVAAMAGLALPVVARARTVFAFDCRQTIDGPFPLIVDPANVWVRREPPIYLAGTRPDPDPDVAVDDFAVRGDQWEATVWPALAQRVPAFERAKVVRSWTGHYDVNVLDANAVIGPPAGLPNFLFANGFSGHGLQHSPGVGRALAELIVDGRYTTIDLSELGYERITAGRPFRELAIIA